MEKKLTIEELEAKYKQLGAELEARKKAEAAEKAAKLEKEKDARYKEIMDTYKKFEELKDKFVEDYGFFTFDINGRVPSLWDWIF